MPHVDFTMESGLIDRVITLGSWFLVTTCGIGALWLVIIREIPIGCYYSPPVPKKKKNKKRKKRAGTDPEWGKAGPVILSQ